MPLYLIVVLSVVQTFLLRFLFTVVPPFDAVMGTENYASTLLKYEGEILNALEVKDQDLISFAGLLIDQALLSLDVIGELEIMYKGVPYQRRLRYVMQHVRVNVGLEKRSYKRFLKVLSSIPNGKMVVKKLRKKGQSSSTKKSKYLIDSGRLGEKDLRPLYDSLSKFSYKWEAIAILLINDIDKINHIRTQCRDDLNRCLFEVLQAWLLEDCNNGLSPTVKNLKEVMQSESVMLSREFKLNECLKKWQDLPGSSSGSSGSDSSGNCSSTEAETNENGHETLLILGQPKEKIDINKKTAVLLEVDVKAQVDVVVKYNWFKNGIRIQHGSFRVICITVEDIRAEGAYSCVCFLNHKKMMSNIVNICVKTSVDDLKKVLVKKYLKEPEIKVDIWPTVCQDTYIQLAITHNRDVQLSDCFSCQTIQGGIDDIFSEKHHVDYMSTFDSLDLDDRVLVEGRPGSGKTTLVHKVSRDWASGKFKWRKLRLLFKVHLRAFKNKSFITLEDIVGLYFSSGSIEIIAKYAEKHHGFGIGFILDGMDEYHPRKIQDTYIHNLINRFCLPNALVIVASRPASVTLYRGEANLRVEVLGFFKKQIFEYITFYKFSSESKKSDLMEYLKFHPNIYHMCYLPLQTAMICFLYDRLEKGRFPQTETEVYEEFAKHALLRTLYRYVDLSDYNLKSIFALEGDEKKSFDEICALAFSKTICSEQIHFKSDVDKPAFSCDSYSSLGLISVDMVATENGLESMYTFVHVTFQEFLAACHVFQLPQDTQLEIIQEFSGQKCMKVVFKFYCGLLQRDNNCLLLKALINHANLDLVSKLQWLFESKQKNSCEFVANDGCLDIRGHSWSLNDVVLLGHTIVSAKSNPVMLLKMSVFQREDSVAIFHKEIQKGRNLIKELHLHIPDETNEINYPLSSFFEVIACIMKNSVSQVSFRFSSNDLDTAHFNGLMKVLRSSKNLSSLDFSCIGLGDEEVCCVATIIEQGKLTSLNLSGNEICDNGAHTLGTAVLNCTNLVSLDLSGNNISDDGAKYLTLAFERLEKLEIFKFSGNNISEVGAKHFSFAFNKLKNLRTLDLSLHPFISDKGTLFLASSFRNLTRLTVLDLSGIKILASGTQYLGHALNCLSSLKALYLSSNMISNVGTIGLAPVLCKLVNLSTLDLSRNDISLAGAKALTNSLQGMKNLTTLDLSENYIGDEGAEVLSCSLRSLAYLSELYLSNNGMSDVGACALINSFSDLSNLATIDLSQNYISDAAANLLASCSCNMVQLAQLNLSHNNISYIGAISFSDTINHNKNLKSLNLTGNDIDDDEINELATLWGDLVILTKMDWDDE